MPPVTRRRASPLVRVGMIAFAIGVVAVGVIMVLFASGAEDLPLALNLTAMLAPVGFGVAMVGVWREARRASAEAAAATEESAMPGESPR
jgi:Na+/proline symporter